jgi:hypothetical protein
MPRTSGRPAFCKLNPTNRVLTNMTIIKVEPTKDHPVPYDTRDEKPDTFMDEIAIAGNTAELQMAMGAPLEIREEDVGATKALLNAAIRNKKSKALTQRTMAVAAASFLREYGMQLAFDVAETRAAITHKLMELANCGDPKYELKALELLGKHSDIGLFTERSEITISYKNPEDLESAIKERVKRLLNADIIDVTPIGVDLDEELGVFEGEDEVVVEPEDTPLMDELDEDDEV